MSNRTQAGGEPYAHLRNRRAAGKDADTETDPKGKKVERSGDVDDDDKNEDKKKDDLDDKKDDAEDKDAPGGKKGKKAKGKKAEDDDGGSGNDDDDDDEVEAARQGERARCAAIFQSPHAAGRIEAACVLAFETDMSANKAIKTLKALNVGATAPAPKKSDEEDRASERRALRERMATQPNPDVGDDIEKKPEPTGAKAFAKRMAEVNQIRHGQA